VIAKPDEFDALRVERRDGGIAIVWIDVPGEEVNLLKRGFDQELNRVLDELEDAPGLAAVVLASAKPDSFIAGADVHVIRELESAEEASRLADAAQQMVDRLASFAHPIVAAIHGACLGGGLEMALACRERVASDHEKTEIGQPEVKLGLIPAAGGTVRLPRLVGLEHALDLILSGKKIRAQQAKTLGLVDEVVHPSIVVDVALERAKRLAASTDKPGLAKRTRNAIGSAANPERLKELMLEDNPAGRKLLFGIARKRVLARTHGKMPAPLRALEVIKQGVEDGVDAGLRAEAKAFGELAVSPEAKNLIDLFLANNSLKKEPGADAEPHDVRKIGVLGAGLMGGGIAFVTAAEADLPVRMKDVDHGKIRHGLSAIRDALSERVEKRAMTKQQSERALHMVRPTTDYSGFGRVDVVIEAVAEKLDLKRKVVREVEERSKPEMIFASNTSSIPISEIAEASKQPEQVIGMHYFSPVEKVPLLEVVVGERTAAWVVATCVALGKRQGKTVIVVNDGTGFYTTRILGPYIAEAGRLITEGVAIEQIDHALVEFGFPVGPIRLLDEVGIDVAHEIGGILRAAYGERMVAPGVLERMVAEDRLGKKKGRGFYRYKKLEDGTFDREDEEVDESVYELLGVKPESQSDEQEIARRCVLALVNEAVRCYEDGVLRSARDGDVGAVFGLGFPAFLGGPFRYVDQERADKVVSRLEEYRGRFGDRFAPPDLLRRLAEGEIRFHSEAAPPPGESARPVAHVSA
jgi:3-hydroxyacyl-CoA dehydrogenase/enoyl-CoA hydratase/3-hydroxybutyryl-CoA epimerase